MKKVVRILAVAAVTVASISALSTPISSTPIEDKQTLGAGSAPRPPCPISICSEPEVKKR